MKISHLKNSDKIKNKLKKEKTYLHESLTEWKEKEIASTKQKIKRFGNFINAS